MIVPPNNARPCRIFSSLEMETTLTEEGQPSGGDPPKAPIIPSRRAALGKPPTGHPEHPRDLATSLVRTTTPFEYIAKMRRHMERIITKGLAL